MIFGGCSNEEKPLFRLPSVFVLCVCVFVLPSTSLILLFLTDPYTETSDCQRNMLKKMFFVFFFITNLAIFV